MENDFAHVDLSGLDDGYSNAEVVSKPNQENPPNGKYRVVVSKAALGTAKTTGTAMLNWQLRILEGDYAGRILFKTNFITTKTLSYLKTDLVLCGLELERVSDLSERLGELLDVILEVFVKNGEKYANVYLNKRLDLSDLSTQGQEKAAIDSFDDNDDDIPF